MPHPNGQSLHLQRFHCCSALQYQRGGTKEKSKEIGSGRHGCHVVLGILLLTRQLPWIFYFYFLSGGRNRPIRFMDYMDCKAASRHDSFLQGAAIEQNNLLCKCLLTADSGSCCL